MAYRIYILPMISVVDPDLPYRAPKYIHNSNYVWGAIDYGSEDTCIVLINDITQTDHDSLIGLSDVMALPENLDQDMGNGAVNSAQTYLENLNIPANWINTNRTFRTVAKIIIGLFQFNQRWASLSNNNSPFKDGLNLETKYNEMTSGVQQRLRDCFDSLSIDRTMLTANSSIREALFEFGSQFSNRQITIGGVVI